MSAEGALGVKELQDFLFSASPLPQTYMEKLPLKLREKIYPSKMTLIKPLIMYHLLSKENQEKLLRDLENNALPMYLLIRKYPMLKKPAILFKLLSKENQERFKKGIKRVLPINYLLNKKDNANKKYKRGI